MKRIGQLLLATALLWLQEDRPAATANNMDMRTIFFIKINLIVLYLEVEDGLVLNPYLVSCVRL